ncbi:Tubulin-specific chaperone D [Halotydeus destructor]|nr:Tubulin-specific chaperone D [Halotydeus destructor]
MSCSISDDSLELVKKGLYDLVAEVRDLPENDGKELSRPAEKICEKFVDKISFYQEQPHLLDRYLADLVEKLVEIIKNSNGLSLQLHSASSLLHAVCKTRGFKAVIKLLPHEVSDLVRVLDLLKQCDTEDRKHWSTSYILLRWLSILLLIPISLKRFDGNETDESFTSRVYALIKTNLKAGGVNSEAAAFLAAKFFIRPETGDELISDFVDWSCKELLCENDSVLKVDTKNSILLALAYFYKIGKREVLVKYSPKILQTVDESKSSASCHEKMVKHTMKLAQRVGLGFMKRKVASWRYQRGKRYLNETNSADSGDSGYQQSVFESDSDFLEAEEYGEYLAAVVDLLLTGLRHENTIVRWSAAKGVGRIVERLPMEMANEVTVSLLDLFSFGERDFAWHGGCLALAELGRRGLILPVNFPEVFVVLKKALVYDELKGTYFTGAHVRDAACYLCWSFARAYEAKVMQPYVQDLASNLVVVSLFDREISCRRAAAAALQENVGRQGNFPHGIDLVTKIDYQEVGQVHHAFTELAVYVSQFTEYVRSLIDHLVDKKIPHWDPEIRQLAAKSLGLICFKTNPDYITDTVIAKLIAMSLDSAMNTRHGSLLALSEIISAFNLHDTAIPEHLVQHVSFLTVHLDNKKVFRGAGSDLMKTAFCQLVQSCASSKLVIDGSTQQLWSSILQEIIFSTSAATRAIGAESLSRFADAHRADNPDYVNQLIDKLFHSFDDSKDATRSGAFETLARIRNASLVNPRMHEILRNVISYVNRTDNTSKVLTDVRADAIKCSIQLCKKLSETDLVTVTDSVFTNCLFVGLEDYTSTSKGDGGFDVRLASLHALKELIDHITEKYPDLLDANILAQASSHILTLCVSNNEKLRNEACSTFVQLIHSGLNVPNKEALQLTLPKDIDQSVYLDQFVQLLRIKDYAISIWKGLVSSLGGRTQSTANKARLTLSAFLKSIFKDKELYAMVTDTFLNYFNVALEVDRIQVPLLNTCSFLVSSGLLDGIPMTQMTSLMRKAYNCAKRSADPVKVSAAATLMCDSIRFKECVKLALSYIVVMLCNRYATVRIKLAEELNVAILTYSDDIFPADNCDELSEQCLTILQETNWRNPVPEIKGARNALCDLLGVAVPTISSEKK